MAPEGWQPFARERDELSWYFAGLGPTVGLRASPLEPSSRGIFDDYASHMAHMQRRDHLHRAELRRLDLVERTLAAAVIARGTLAHAFTPVGAARASYRTQTALAWEGQCLVGLAVTTTAFDRLYAARTPDYDPDTSGRPGINLRLRVLEDEVGTLKRGNRIPSSHRLHRVLVESIDRFCVAIVDYAGCRMRVLADRRAQRQAENDVFIMNVAKGLGLR